MGKFPNPTGKREGVGSRLARAVALEGSRTREHRSSAAKGLLEKLCWGGWTGLREAGGF